MVQLVSDYPRDMSQGMKKIQKMAHPLPEFQDPPVREVVLAVQFERLDVLRAPQLGLIWQSFRDRFPTTEEHPPLEPAFERFGPRVGSRPAVHFEMLAKLPSPRIWFVNADGSELVQVQQDRFIRNWRKQNGGQPYPRYSVLRQQFVEDFSLFLNIVAEQGWGNVEPNQCEVTYVNLITAGQNGRSPGEIDQILTLFRPAYSDEGLGAPEEVTLGATYLIKGAADEPIGRLRVNAQPVVRVADGSSAIRLTLSARGLPDGGAIESALGFLDRGHEMIVRAFASITTPSMHSLWGRSK